MTVKELVAILNTLPSNATVVYAPETADKPYIVDWSVYDKYINIVTLAGTEIFEEDPCEYCEEGICHDCCNDIPDDVNDDYDPADIGWDI